MIRIIGSILLAGGTVIIGLSASAAVSERVRALNAWIQALYIMRSEICERLSPLPDVLETLATAVPRLESFFALCKKNLEENPYSAFSIVWSKSLSSAGNMHIKEREREVLLGLGNILGRYSAEEQKGELSHALRSLEGIAKTAEQEKEKVGALYAKLGVICGISLLIVFI